MGDNAKETRFMVFQMGSRFNYGRHSVLRREINYVFGFVGRSRHLLSEDVAAEGPFLYFSSSTSNLPSVFVLFIDISSPSRWKRTLRVALHQLLV